MILYWEIWNIFRIFVLGVINNLSLFILSIYINFALYAIQNKPTINWQQANSKEKFPSSWIFMQNFGRVSCHWAIAWIINDNRHQGSPFQGEQTGNIFCRYFQNIAWESSSWQKMNPAKAMHFSELKILKNYKLGSFYDGTYQRCQN